MKGTIEMFLVFVKLHLLFSLQCLLIENFPKVAEHLMKVMSAAEIGQLICQVLGSLPKDLDNYLHNVKLECAKNIISSKLFECLGRKGEELKVKQDICCVPFLLTLI